MRRILLLDVTAMTGDAACIAGLDLDSGDTLRLNDPQPTLQMLERLGGLAPGDVIQVDWTPIPGATRPHLEDGRWRPDTLRKDGVMPFSQVVQAVRAAAFSSIADAFGERWFQGHNHNSAWQPGAGDRSLASIVVRYVRFKADGLGRVRVALRDDGDTYWDGIPYQDLRTRSHMSGCDACDDGYLARVGAEYQANRCLLRVGLTRAVPLGEHPSACWLQVPNIFARPRAHFV